MDFKANMKDIQNISDDLFNIRTTLLNDEDIRKLLFYDSKNALSLPAPSKSDLIVESDTELGYITLFPIMEKGVLSYDRNTFIQITLPAVDIDVDKDDQNMFAGVLITAITDFKHYMLNDNKIRLLEIINRVIKLLDGKKLKSAGKLEAIKVEEVIFDNYVYGYSLKLVFSDMGEGVDF